MKILIVEDEKGLSSSIAAFLQSEQYICEIANDYPAALEKTELYDYACIILDISLPGKDGLEILKDLRVRFPKVKCIVLSMHPEERFALRTLKAGASGYVTKQVAASELVEAIRMVMHGGTYTSEKTTKELVDELLRKSTPELHQSLSDREFVVFLSIAAGKSPAQIANQLSLSINTVNTYRRRILQKMLITNTAELIRYALEHRLL